MLFSGYSRTFSTLGATQYETIGAFWDEMSARYGLENLRGLGLNWTETTIEYIIGLRDGALLPEACPPEAVYREVMLPDAGWVRRTGRTDDLSRIYDEIYRDGPLVYEIECFTEDGFCEILYCR